MSANGYRRETTVLLFLDPYNDFLSEGGLIWERIKDIADEVGLLDNLRAIQAAVRAAGVRVFIVPHRQWQDGDYECGHQVNPSQRKMRSHLYSKRTWGGEFRPEFAPQEGDIVVHQHWAQSGFANTDLDMQLKQHGITHVIVIGLIANTCIEPMARFAMELGYHVTLVRDVTAVFSREQMHAASELNGPTFAHAILTTSDLIGALPQARAAAE